jgi:hypothetical protein
MKNMGTDAMSPSDRIGILYPLLTLCSQFIILFCQLLPAFCIASCFILQRESFNNWIEEEKNKSICQSNNDYQGTSMQGVPQVWTYRE